MYKYVVWGWALLIGVLGAGCATPKFTYQTPPTALRMNGPSIQVLPFTDSRTNRVMDEVLEKNYMVDVQKAIGDELAGMNYFCSVTVITNQANNQSTDWQLQPAVRQLNWEIPRYGALQAKAFAVGICTGLIGGSIYASTGIDVHGYSGFDFTLQKSGQPNSVLLLHYDDIVTNRLKKAVCDTPKTKAKMMADALQKTLGHLKSDIPQKIPTP